MSSGTILLCGGSYGNFSTEWEPPPESKECIAYSKVNGTKVIVLLRARINSSSIVMDDTLFVTGGRFISLSITESKYFLKVAFYAFFLLLP